MLPRVTQPNPYATVETAVAARERGLKVSPSSAWFGVGAAVIVLGVVLGVGLSVPFFRSLVAAPTPAPASGFSLTLDTGAREAIYVEDRFDSRDATCEVTGNGLFAALYRGSSDFSVHRNGYSWVRIGTFRAPIRGEYDVRCTSSADVQFAYGPDPFRHAGRLGAAVLVGLLVVGSGVAILIVTGVRRGRAKRRLLGPPAGLPQWGQPQWPQPQWGQPQPQWPQPQWGQPQPGLATPPPPSAPPAGQDPWATPPS